MPTPPNPAALDLLLTRRSPALNTLTAPGPSRAELETILTAAMRVPDHGRIAPWRFIVYTGAAMQSLCAEVDRVGASIALEPEKLAGLRTRFAAVPAVIAVVFSPRAHPKVPEWEQALSAGAACMNLCLAAHAMGFGAVWYSEWFSTHEAILKWMGVATHPQPSQEKLAGFVWLGTPPSQVREDRERPSLANQVMWP